MPIAPNQLEAGEPKVAKRKAQARGRRNPRRVAHHTRSLGLKPRNPCCPRNQRQGLRPGHRSHSRRCQAPRRSPVRRPAGAWVASRSSGRPTVLVPPGRGSELPAAAGRRPPRRRAGW